MIYVLRWFFRRRLRLTLIGDQEDIHEPAMELHLQKLQYPEFRYMDFLQEKSVSVDDHPLKQSFREKLNLCQDFFLILFMKNHNFTKIHI